MRALVLSGGAVKGAYQVGVLKKWMFEEGLDYDIMCGVSVGALNVSGLAQVPLGHPQTSFSRMMKIWTNINNSTVYKDWPVFGKVAALWKPSFLNSQPLIDYVHANLNVDAVKKSGRIIRVGAVCLDTGEHRFGTEKDDNLADWVLASSSYPIFLNPIQIEGKIWSDGGIASITPLGEAIRLGATEIDVVMCSDPDTTDTWGTKNPSAIPDMIIRLIDLQSDQILRSDLQMVGIKNDLAELNPKYKHIKIRLVKPSVSLTNNSLDFNPESIKKMIEIGYADSNNFQIFE